MKKISLFFMMMILAFSLILMGCNQDTGVDEEPPAEDPVEEPDAGEPADEEPAVETPAGETGYDDGRYRGTYGDRGQEQVGIQFDIEDNVFTAVSFRELQYGDNSFRSMEEADAMYGIKLQYEQAAEYLVGKPLEAIYELKSPGDFVDDIDAFSGATIRSNKVFSAIKDGLNRGLYSPANDDFSREIATYDDGRYRGTYGDRGQEQVGIQFDIEDNVFTAVSFRELQYSDNSFRSMEEADAMYGIKLQYEQAAEYLVGKPLEAVYDLHSPGAIVDDIDAFSGATIRSNKMFSAIKDGLNRGLYAPANDFSADMDAYEDGRYRGTYGDRGQEQVGIQFEIENNVFTAVSFRELQYSDNSFRSMEETDAMYGIKLQYEQAAEYLVGQPLEAVYDLHSPGDFVEDVDGFSGATIRSNKVFSAIKDGLNRGIY